MVRRDHLKSRERLIRVRERRLKKLLRHLKNSPFYSHYALKKSLDAFPVIGKEVFMKNFDTINTRGIRKEEALTIALEAEENRDFSKTIRGVTIGLSTGTSGNKGLFLAGEKERARWAAAVIHRIVGVRLRPRKVAFFLRANSKLYESANSVWLRFNFFDLMNDHESNFSRLVLLKPDILVAQPSALLKIAASYSQSGITPAIGKVISVAEVLTGYDRFRLEKVFGVPLDEVYQCTEGLLANSCRLGKLHFNEDYLIIEKDYIDRGKGRYSPIITDLYRRTQPVVRYRLDDILVEGDACSCGSHFEVIELIEGRTDDIIRLADRSGTMRDIFPDYFSRAITIASDNVTDYTLTQTGEKRIEIYINDESNETQQAVRDSIDALLSKFDIEQVKSGLFRKDSQIKH